MNYKAPNLKPPISFRVYLTISNDKLLKSGTNKGFIVMIILIIGVLSDINIFAFILFYSILKSDTHLFQQAETLDLKINRGRLSLTLFISQRHFCSYKYVILAEMFKLLLEFPNTRYNEIHIQNF